MKISRGCVVVLGLLVVALALSTNVGLGQRLIRQPGLPVQPNPTLNTGTAAQNSSVKIIEDPRYRQVIEVGRDLIRDEVWSEAVKVLQTILDEKEDFYVQVREQDPLDPKKENVRWSSVKFEANNLIGSMKAQGLEAYELAQGANAKSLLDDAKRLGDREKLAEVAQRYCHTKAGIEANEILATLFLARGQVFTAALRFEKLLEMPEERTKVSDLTLYKAALAFRRAGDTKNYEDTWERLQKRLNNAPLKVGTEFVPVARLKAVLEEIPKVDPVNIYDWPMVRGNNKHTAQAVGSPPLMDTKIWERKIMLDKLDGFPDIDPDQAAEARVNEAIKQANDQHHAVLPGFFPVVSQGVMVYRSQRDVRAVALKNIKIKDLESGDTIETPAGHILWKTIPLKRSLSVLLEKNNTRIKADQWLDSYKMVPGFNSFLYDNSLIGTLATDHRNVYVIDDLAVPPHPNMFGQFAFNNPQLNPGELKPLLMQNELAAYDLITGKLRWDLNHTDEMFKDSHFLSMPISVGGKLYVLNEKLLNPTENVGGNPFGGQQYMIGGEAELRLICIDPTKMVEKNKPAIVGKPQSLGHVLQFNRFVQDIGRRVNTVHLAYGDGTLVCPTNAGEVFGIDLMTRSLVWSYPYRESPHQQIQLPNIGFNPNPFPQPNPRMTGTTTVISKWKSAPPAIQDGKIVFTAPDADSVHCISLRDGKPIWKRGQNKGDLYMAGVYGGRVVIVGETQVRILDLKNGDQLKTISTGDLPSGQGVASKGIYYLPLKKGEILAIDIAKGEIKAHNRSAVQGTTPGNLVFYEGMVLSQTPTEVVAYPQLVARLDIAKAEAAKNPDNLATLTEYGDLLLKDGQVHLAVSTLLKVYDAKPADPLGQRVRARLFEALTDLMQVDFPKASKDYLETYRSLCSVPGNNGEEQQRLAKYFRLVGQGREAEGNLVDAFKMYKDFGGLPLHKQNGGITTPEDPNTKIPVNVWLRGRISGMLAKATPQQKAPLEATIADEWKIVDAKKDLEAIRTFVGMFDIPVKVGRDARIRLAETIMERSDKPAFLEAEMSLYQITSSEYRKDPATGGRALATLAKLEEAKATSDSTRLAAAYYRDLNRDFPKDAVRGAKTGADLFSELATDKRFLPYLEDRSSPWGPVKIAARELGAGAFNVGLAGFVLQPKGDETPFAREHRLMLDPSDTINPRVRLRSLGSGADRWTTNLGQVPMNQQLFFHLYQQGNVNMNMGYHPNAHHRFFHVKGHLIVCQVGVMVYCLDGDTGKELWKMQTVENIQQNGLVHLQEVRNDSEGNPQFWYWNQLTNSRFAVKLGHIGTAQASYVALLGHKGLTVVEPLRGGTMWSKPDVPVGSHVFGDDQYLFLVEMNDNGSFGAGRTIRASDGEAQMVPDFSSIYQARVRLMGRNILAAQNSPKGFTVRLYDIIAGKDQWSKEFPTGSFVLQTEDNAVAGVIDPKGNLTVMDANTGKEVLTTNIVRNRVTTEDLKGLRNPLLLHDNEQYYIALNKPIDPARVAQGVLHNNFNNGARCLPVNGWFLFVQKHDGSRKVGQRELTWKKGDVWHSIVPIQNQMIVMEQFDQSPVILFTARYHELMPNGGNRWVSVTQSLSKTSGLLVYDSGPRGINGVSPMFSTVQIDMKARTLNLIGFSGSVQHYVDDGKGPPPAQGAGMAPGGNQPGTNVAAPFAADPAGVLVPINGGVLPPNGRLPLIRRQLQPVAPPVVVPKVQK
ncbi:MAG TPA: PQQ-binding-like beta-propeller repeat protein [Gemmataceae bacterium]|nr:PQQ-binding-like beta-propeller repeat protein [Gemmataceae bacterium]